MGVAAQLSTAKLAPSYGMAWGMPFKSPTRVLAAHSTMPVVPTPFLSHGVRRSGVNVSSIALV
jgi:hypothetical protein